MLGVFWNPQDLLLLMGTEIFKIDASWTEKLTKTRGSQRFCRQLYIHQDLVLVALVISLVWCLPEQSVWKSSFLLKNVGKIINFWRRSAPAPPYWHWRMAQEKMLRCAHGCWYLGWIMVAVILKEKYCRIPMKKKFVVYDRAVASWQENNRWEMLAESPSPPAVGGETASSCHPAPWRPADARQPAPDVWTRTQAWQCSNGHHCIR